MDLHLLAVGKLKDAGLDRLCEAWVERSRRMLPIRRETFRDAKAMWSRIDALGPPLVLLDERGSQVDTDALTGWVRRWRDEGRRQVVFAIGDAHGFAPADRERADELLGLSKLTLPHRLAHVVLCEQLYRVGTILAGHPYHHA